MTATDTSKSSNNIFDQKYILIKALMVISDELCKYKDGINLFKFHKVRDEIKKLAYHEYSNMDRFIEFYNERERLTSGKFYEFYKTILNILNVSQYCFKIKVNLIFQEMLNRVTNKFNITPKGYDNYSEYVSFGVLIKIFK
jgi:hypothetical protein